MNDSYADISICWDALVHRSALRTFLCTLSFRKISVASSRCWFSKILQVVSYRVSSIVDVPALRETRPSGTLYSLLRIPGKQWQVQDERDPVSIDEEEDSEERVNRGLGDDVCVEAVAEVDRVNVVAASPG